MPYYTEHKDTGERVEVEKLDYDNCFNCTHCGPNRYDGIGYCSILLEVYYDEDGNRVEKERPLREMVYEGKKCKHYERDTQCLNHKF